MDKKGSSGSSEYSPRTEEEERLDEDKTLMVSVVYDDEEDGGGAGGGGGGSKKGAPTSPPALRGMDLDLSFAAASKNDSSSSERGGGASSCRSSRGLQEDSVLVVFDLPDGSQGESTFKLGQTVEVLKAFVESEYGIPMRLQTLFYEEKPMMDPLSLLDFPSANESKGGDGGGGGGKGVGGWRKCA